MYLHHNNYLWFNFIWMSKTTIVQFVYSLNNPSVKNSMSQICVLVLPRPWTKCTHLRRSLDISGIRPHRRRWLRCQGWWRTQVIVALDGTSLHRRWLVLDASDVYKNNNKYVTLITGWMAPTKLIVAQAPLKIRSPIGRIDINQICHENLCGINTGFSH